MSKITESARGEDCQIRLEGICNFDETTTVFCHINSGGGTKQPDTEGAYGCSSCHSEVDGRTGFRLDRDMVELHHHEGAMRTRKILVDKGLLILK